MFQVGSEYELRAGAASVLDNINRWVDILTNIVNRWAEIVSTGGQIFPEIVSTGEQKNL
jgi:hypothetical protein